jgi:hypothetical protein
MMPGMAPPPPGAYIPGPFVQPMPYPPTMPPPNGESVPTRLFLRLSLILSRSSHVRITTDGSDATYVPKFRLLISWMLNACSAPQAYMQAPPPGQYPPPPNGAGPRPSMPPTPIPAHAHPYYHQSPQRRAHLSFRTIDQTIHSKFPQSLKLSRIR